MTLGGKKVCDQIKPAFPGQPSSSHATWNAHHATLIGKTRDSPGGEDKFQAAIAKFTPDLVEKFHKARTPESEISVYCNEIADWLPNLSTEPRTLL